MNERCSDTNGCKVQGSTAEPQMEAVRDNDGCPYERETLRREWRQMRANFESTLSELFDVTAERDMANRLAVEKYFKFARQQERADGLQDDLESTLSELFNVTAERDKLLVDFESTLSELYDAKTPDAIRYYEFRGKFPYYALIAARAEYEAIGLYITEVSNFEDKCVGEMPSEVTRGYVCKLFANAAAEDKDTPEELDEFEAENRFVLPYVVLIDGEFC